MNTKTSLKSVYNYYNGTDHGVGRDSPGALLDMLAEVASQTLHSEKKFNESVTTVANKLKTNAVEAFGGKKKSNQETIFNSSQLLSMPATQLVKQFSLFTSDELKRQYSYTCALVPGCGQRYTSFASEGRARMSIKAHLAEHLDYLKRDKEAYSSFTAVAVKHGRNSKSSQSSKKPRVCGGQQKKPAELLNKENKDAKKDAGKSTNYLRKILSNEMSFTEFEKEKDLAKNNLQVDNETADAEAQVLGDHSYFEQAKGDKDNDDISQIMVNEAMGENIMLMVVESDGVHMKELPYIAHDISVRSNDHDDNETIYIPESVNWSEEVYAAKNMEISAPAKPKGKAKFIGTSKEEREMALALMDRIKRKGNPAGGNLQCRICDPPRSFTAPTTLVSHYRSHAGIKPYECRICRAVFTRRHSLKYHMLIHQNQTRFTCADCGKKFRHPSHFREHRRRHTGEAPFGCEDCGQRFKTRNTYKRHLKTRHGKVLTTNGELLHLSEEDFQKVRTNPKRRSETVNSESMVDEDVTAPEMILQLDENSGKEDNSGADQLWDNDNEDRYRDYEYFDKSQGDKTEIYTKTDVALDKCEFDDDKVEEDDNREIELVKCEGGTNFDESIDNQEEILYDDNLRKKKSNIVDYVEGIECEESYDGDVAVLRGADENYEVEETQVDYFETNLSMERYEDVDFSNCKGDELILPDIDEADGIEQRSHDTNENRFFIDGAEIGHEEEVVDEARFPRQYLLQGIETTSVDNKVAVERIVEYPTTNYDADENLVSPHNMPRIYLQANQSSNNIIIENKELMNILSHRIKLQKQENPDDNGESKNISSNGDVVTLLNGKQSQSLNLVQSGQQGTIILLSSNNEEKNNYLHIDNTNGIKTLPVIAVQQK